MKRYFATFMILFVFSLTTFGQGDGFLIKNGERIFPIGWYHFPKEDEDFQEIVDAGFNIIRCGSKADLDRVQAAGVSGWVSLPLQNGVTDDFKKQVGSMAGHPALGLWEGPDEIILSFTQDYQYRDLGRFTDNKGRFITWRNRTPEMEKYAAEIAPGIMKNMHEAISYIRTHDPNNLQVWMNEGAHSSPFYIRQYLDAIDIIGCDHYPVYGVEKNGSPARRNIEEIGYVTEQFGEIGMGKPVYIILQANSKHEEGPKADSIWHPDYPSFEESRYMAYSVITHGGKGVFYWGGYLIGTRNTPTAENFRQSLYSLASELNALQPFLIAPEQKQVSAYYLKDFERKEPSGSLFQNQIAWAARQFGRDWMIILSNDDSITLQNVAVKGLKNLNGFTFYELYGEETVEVANEEFITRLKPHEVKVFVTSRKWESTRLKERDYPGYHPGRE